MKSSDKVHDFIMSKESCQTKAYKCPAGIWTIGYGHTNNVRPGQTISKQQASDYFKEDISVFDEWLTKLCSRNNVNLSQNQFDACISFAYNIGTGAFEKSTVWKKIKNNPNDQSIKDSWLQWSKANGKTLQGLVERRKDELTKFYFI